MKNLVFLLTVVFRSAFQVRGKDGSIESLTLFQNGEHLAIRIQ